MPLLRRAGTIARWASYYARNLWRKGARDQVFFLSSGITFNVLVTIVPLILLTISILGHLVASSTSAREEIMAFAVRAMPIDAEQTQAMLSSVVDDKGLFGVLGIIGLVWATTRLFGSLRTVLEVVFEIPPEDRLGIVEGKIHDIKLVLVVGTLFLLTISLTTALRWIRNYGVEAFGLRAYDLSWVWSFSSMTLTLTITYFMFYFVYRYAPDRSIPRKDAALAALFTGALFEAAKYVFIAYLSNFSRLLELYGSFTNLAVVAFWIYYSSIVFIVGGELARISQVHRARGARPGWPVWEPGR